MQKILHRAEDRGTAEHGWLSTRFSFSFAEWYDESRMGYGALRVLNDDNVAPHSGFPMHPHRDMEIITVVTNGAVTHEDSLGTHDVVKAGEVQVMSAGTGVVHSEFNNEDETLRLFQLWIVPKLRGVVPRYAKKSFGLTDSKPGITLLVGPDGTEGVLPIHQDAFLSYAVLDETHPSAYMLQHKKNGVYVFVIDGTIDVADETLAARDALGVSGISELTLRAPKAARALIIETPL